MYVAKLCKYLHDKQMKDKRRRTGFGATSPDDMDAPLLLLGRSPSLNSDQTLRRNSFHGELEDVEKRRQEEEDYRHWKDAYIYAACSGAIGSVSVLLGGLTSKILVMAFNGNNEFGS